MSKSKKPASNPKLEIKLQDLEAKWKRALADYQNLEKRFTTEKAQFVKLSNATLISQLLSVLDDLERAANHLKNDGLNMVTYRFLDILKTEGLTELEVTGKPFDPNSMECVDSVVGPKDQVVKVITKGYQLNDIILRPAKVEVGNGEK